MCENLWSVWLELLNWSLCCKLQNYFHQQQNHQMWIPPPPFLECGKYVSVIHTHENLCLETQSNRLQVMVGSYVLQLD